MQYGMWNESYNWTYEQLCNVIHKVFDIEKSNSVCLDVEHSDRKNMDDIVRWVADMGYNAEEKNMDTIRIWRKE